jgi:hypothetical protein
MHMKMDLFCYVSSQKKFSNMNNKGLEGQKYKRISFGEKCWKLLWLNDVIYNISKIGLRLCAKVIATTFGEYTLHSSIWTWQPWWCTMFFALIA